MKKMLMMTALAMFAMSAAGCGQMRSWWNRGDACNACDTNVVYDDGVVMAPPAMMPVLPDGTFEALPAPYAQ